MSKYGDLRFNNVFCKILNNTNIFSIKLELNLFRKTVLNKLDELVNLFLDKFPQLN